MKDKITAQVGQVIEVNGKQYRATESGFELITVKRGPLGGVLKRLDQCKIGQRVIVGAVVGENCCLHFDGVVGRNLLVETNIPPRPTFTPMTAGEAAKLPDIVGRWVAFPVGLTRDAFEPLALDAGEAEGLIWLDSDTDLFLIEGVGL